MDATANDMPGEKLGYTASGFPTIYLAPAGKKDKPVSYEGAREVADFVSFIQKNGNTFKAGEDTDL
jgi:hypothetical protein